MLLSEIEKKRVEKIVWDTPEINQIGIFEVELMIRYIKEQADEILTLEIAAGQNNEFSNPE